MTLAEISGGEGYEIYTDDKFKVIRIPGVDVGTSVGDRVRAEAPSLHI